MTSSKTCSTVNPLLFVLLLALTSSVSRAGTVSKSYVDYDGDEYHLNLIMNINAPSTKVWHLLTDYKNLQKVNPVIQQSQVLKRGITTRVKIVSEGCIWFFCRMITQVQDIRDLGQGYLVISEVKDKSDFVSGYTMWHVLPHKEQTKVTIRARLKPDFWIPPLIGPWLFQDALLEQGYTVINNLETLSKQQALP
jgi:carbon monoxide dehydrogenase subunit G